MVLIHCIFKYAFDWWESAFNQLKSILPVNLPAKYFSIRFIKLTSV